MSRPKRSTTEEKLINSKKFDTVFAKRLSELVKARKNEIGKEQLANDLDVSKRIIELWEAQQSRPDIERLKDLAEYFGVTVDYLVGKSDNITPTLEDEIAIERYGLSSMALNELKKLHEIGVSKKEIEFLNLILENLGTQLIGFWAASSIDYINHDKHNSTQDTQYSKNSLEFDFDYYDFAMYGLTKSFERFMLDFSKNEKIRERIRMLINEIEQSD